MDLVTGGADFIGSNLVLSTLEPEQRTDVRGEAFRGERRFLQVSTGEVCGSLGPIGSSYYRIRRKD